MILYLQKAEYGLYKIMVWKSGFEPAAPRKILEACHFILHKHVLPLSMRKWTTFISSKYLLFFFHIHSFYYSFFHLEFLQILSTAIQILYFLPNKILVMSYSMKTSFSQLWELFLPPLNFTWVLFLCFIWHHHFCLIIVAFWALLTFQQIFDFMKRRIKLSKLYIANCKPHDLFVQHVQ